MNGHLRIPAFLPPENESTVIVKVKVKVNFTLEQPAKAQRGSRGIALLFS